MALQWTVRKVAAEENIPDATFILGLSEDDEGAGKYLIFQIKLGESTGQDRRLGFDTYCIVDEEHRVAYGGVEQVALDGRSLRLNFSDRTAFMLDMEQRELELLLDIDEREIDDMWNELNRVLRFGNPDQFPQRFDCSK